MIRILRQIFSTGIVTEDVSVQEAAHIKVLGDRLEEAVKKRFRGSLTIRHVDAGSCNGCELEIHALNNPIYNCERYGIHFTASPRFADMLLVTGPVSRNMEIALKRTYDATPTPKIVVAVGDCGCNGGIFSETYASLGGIDKVIPVDAYISGCPPTPSALLNGILKAIEGKEGERS
jgi:Ni,Fe-hydrogenase III small subunit